MGAGVAVGVVLLLLCLVGLGFWVKHRKKQRFDIGAGRRGPSVSGGGVGGGGGGGVSGGLQRASTMVIKGV